MITLFLMKKGILPSNFYALMEFDNVYLNFLGYPSHNFPPCSFSPSFWTNVL